ncbi:MAG: cadherin-like beta sandwich domain-containing protein [Clostridia bacterium]|nr:cadherin-like beta sandwich domain-containing protein [Clostridia bacterium]
MTAYSVTTTNATNKVTATAEDAAATVQIMNGENEIANGSSASWADGENTLTITVKNGDKTQVYTVTVTKS